MRCGDRKGPELKCARCKAPFYAPPCAHRLFCTLKCYRASKRFTPERFWARVAKGPKNACWTWLGGTDRSDGYGRVYDGRRTRQAQAVAWELANNRKVPRNKMVLHTCDNPPCCNPRHLNPGDAKKNSEDVIQRGRARIAYLNVEVPLHRRPRGVRNGMRLHPESVQRGVKNVNSKITDAQVRAIRRARANGVTLIKLARQFDVSTSQVHRIAHHESWAHIGEYK